MSIPQVLQLNKPQAELIISSTICTPCPVVPLLWALWHRIYQFTQGLNLNGFLKSFSTPTATPYLNTWIVALSFVTAEIQGSLRLVHSTLVTINVQAYILIQSHLVYFQKLYSIFPTSGFPKANLGSTIPVYHIS